MDAEEWDERYRGAELVWGAEPNRFVREQLTGRPPGRAADLACGEGRNSLWLARQGWQVVGLDFSAAAIERARTLTAQEPVEVAGRLTWRVADATRPPLEPASLDLVLIVYLHLPPAQAGLVLEAAVTALRAGGILLLVGHDRRNLHEGVGGPQEAALLHDPREVRERLELLGLHVELAETVPRPTDAGTALDTLVRAARR